MTPDEFKLLGKHIAGGAVYISNIILWKEVGYFDISSDLKPLLHLWSLGIEEQFYIVWPFVILFLLKFKFRLDSFLFLFFLASFLFNLKMVHPHPQGTFYAPPTRFWELAVGGVLAAICYRASPIWDRIGQLCGGRLNSLIYTDETQGNEKKICKDVLSLVGFILIVYAILFFNSGMVFPGSRALIPTLGTAMIIAAGPDAIVNKRILSPKIMVFIGLISYPLYLWHWPLLSFAKIIYSEVPPRLIRIALVITAILLAWITYRFIEPPLRWGKHSRIKAVCLFITLLTIGFSGIKIFLNYGYPERLGYMTEEILRDQELDKIISESAKRCNAVLPDYEKNSAKDECVFQKENHKNTIALFGDSHSRYLSYGLIDILSKKFPEEGLVRFAVSGTAPLINFRRRNTPSLKNGYLAHLEGYDYIFSDDKIKTVVIATYPIIWFKMKTETTIPYYRNVLASVDGMEDITDLGEQDKDVLLERGLRRTFDAIKQHNKKLVFVMDNPDFFFDPHICVERPYQKIIGKKLDKKCYSKRKDLENNETKIWFNSILKKVAKDYDNITLFNAFDSLCDGNICPIIKNGKLLYRDDDHVSNEGARMIAKDLLNIIFK